MKKAVKQIPVPLQNKVLILPLETLTKQTGRAYAPETEKEDKKKSEKGKIIELGKEYSGELKRNDIVFFDKFSGEYFVINSQEYYCVIPESVFVVLK